MAIPLLQAPPTVLNVGEEASKHSRQHLLFCQAPAVLVVVKSDGFDTDTTGGSLNARVTLLKDLGRRNHS